MIGHSASPLTGGASSSHCNGTSDLEDLNRTLYDIGAQDMLDIWDHMDAEVGWSMILPPAKSDKWVCCEKAFVEPGLSMLICDS
jgi:hypothetical protein